MTIQVEDDRTTAQRETHNWAVVGTDRFMSGWGKAEGGTSYAAWATTGDNIDNLEYEIRKRSDMQRIRIVNLNDYRPRGNGHLHIYVRCVPNSEAHATCKGWT